jgi:hypothetical protein
MDRRVALRQLVPSPRRVVQRNAPERIAFVQEQIAELGFADARSILQHGLKYGLQIARRTGNHAQHPRSRGLLLQRLGELLFQVGNGCAKAVNVSSRLRFVRTKTGNASSALCAFERQGSPRRHSHWSRPVSPAYQS